MFLFWNLVTLVTAKHLSEIMKKCLQVEFLYLRKYFGLPSCLKILKAVSNGRTTHLAPTSLCYLLTVKEGVTDHGVQYNLRCIYEHKLQRSSFNFCYGPFGGVKGLFFHHHHIVSLRNGKQYWHSHQKSCEQYGLMGQFFFAIRIYIQWQRYNVHLLSTMFLVSTLKAESRSAHQDHKKHPWSTQPPTYSHHPLI